MSLMEGKESPQARIDRTSHGALLPLEDISSSCCRSVLQCLRHGHPLPFHPSALPITHCRSTSGSAAGASAWSAGTSCRWGGWAAALVGAGRMCTQQRCHCASVAYAAPCGTHPPSLPHPPPDSPCWRAPCHPACCTRRCSLTALRRRQTALTSPCTSRAAARPSSPACSSVPTEASLACASSCLVTDRPSTQARQALGSAAPSVCKQ